MAVEPIDISVSFTIKKGNDIKKATIYKNFREFLDYEEGNCYIGVNPVNNGGQNIGYLYCSKQLYLNRTSYDVTEKYLFSFKAENGQVYHAYQTYPTVGEIIEETYTTSEEEPIEFDGEDFPYGAVVYIVGSKGANGSGGSSGGSGERYYSQGGYHSQTGAGGAGGNGGSGGVSCSISIRTDTDEGKYAIITTYGGYGAGGGGGGGGGGAPDSGSFATIWRGGSGGSGGSASNVSRCAKIEFPSLTSFVITEIFKRNSGLNGGRGESGNNGTSSSGGRGGNGGSNGKGSSGQSGSGSSGYVGGDGGRGANTNETRVADVWGIDNIDYSSYETDIVTSTCVAKTIQNSGGVVVAKRCLYYQT
ncbi:MAG: hypothetical protein BWY47_01701 [Bacteroidetes bacterium ADurb.Bin302]|nr:MAG: hypothetical protein BWY47_01701 [Bacteroidetes bacterium ADurb.Bin302]